MFNQLDSVYLHNNPSKKGKIIKKGKEHAGIQYYTVFWSSDEETIHAGEELRLDKANCTPEESIINKIYSGYHEFQKLMTLKRIDKEVPLSNNIYAFNASKTKFFTYQFKPLMKFLDSRKNRILICDEVGLGKTIEAGIILTELRARQDLQKVLVICPANLRTKWKLELKTRFSEDFEIKNKNEFKETLEEINTNQNLKLNIISSLESLRCKSIITKINEIAPLFDLVIIDEAHKMKNKATNQWKFAKTLSDFSGAMILLTATPVHLGNSDLFSLLNILDDEEFSDDYTMNNKFNANKSIIKAQICISQLSPKFSEALEALNELNNFRFFYHNPILSQIKEKLSLSNSFSISKKQNIDYIVDLQKDLSDLNLISHIYTRTRKRDVHKDIAIRNAYSHTVSFTDEEKEFYAAVTKYIRANIRVSNPGFLQWILNTPQRRMSSSIPVMVNHYKENIIMSGIDDDSPESLFEDFNKENSYALKDLKEIIKKWDFTKPDSKYNKFVDIIKEEKRKLTKIKIIVFAFFKGTLRYLRKRLSEDGFTALLIDGDTDIKIREDNIANFKNNDEIEILLSSSVGGEGLDFQFCNTIINYDLPWNPMELEQRIGRIDRIGQKSEKIFIHNLFIEGTVEERILSRLYDRIEIFKHSIGDLEPIIGDIIKELNEVNISETLTDNEKEEKFYNWDLALNRILKDYKKIEDNMSQFVGTDSFFSIEIDNIRKQRRYITGEQLRVFIMEFIKSYCPQTKISYDKSTGIGNIVPDEKLKQIIRENVKTSDMYKFITTQNRGVKITFDSDTAFENSEIEFINILHPIVSIIVRVYKSNNIEFSKTSFIALKTDILKKGFYLFLVYRLNIFGVKTESTFEPVILDIKAEEACSRFDSEVILGEMIEKGDDPENDIELNPEWVKTAVDKGERIFLDYSTKKLEDNRSKNDYFINNRLKSLELSFSKDENRINEQISKTISEFRISMLKAQLEKKKNILEEKRIELESKRKIYRSHELISLGVLEVI